MSKPRSLPQRLIASATMLTLAFGLTGGTATASTELDEQPAEGERSSVLLILDASGSMNRKDPSGVTRLEAAKKALNNTIDSLPPNVDVGLRVYGATVKDKNDSDPSKQACEDSQLIHPIEQLDRAKLKKAVNGFEAVGQTPISHALIEGAKDLGDEGNRHIILVSDGEENCVPDPCKEVESIAGSGITLRIDAVGFAVNDKARNQLSCIADLTNGSYYDAKDADQLDSALRRLSTRAARPFSVQGEPVQGARDEASAPVLTAGHYQDKIRGSNQGDVEVFYKIKRQVPGSSIHVNVMARAPLLAGGILSSSGNWNTQLSTPEGTRCQSHNQLGLDTQRFGKLFSQTVSTYGIDPRVSTPSSSIQECAEAEELILSIKRGKGDEAATLPTAIRVIEEPTPTNVDDLPDGVIDVPSSSTPINKPEPGEAKEVVGSPSFDEAESLAPGTYVTEVVPGETVFFKTPIDWGQSAVFGIDGFAEDPIPPKELFVASSILIDGDVFAPNFSNIDSHSKTSAISIGRDYKSDKFKMRESSNTHDVVPEVRYRNRWDSAEMGDSSRGFAMAGDYYYAIAVADNTSDVRGIPVKIQFTFDVTGTPSGQPEFSSEDEKLTQTGPAEEPTEDDSASAEAGGDKAEDSGGGTNLPLIIGVGAAVIVVGALGFFLGRRRPQS